MVDQEALVRAIADWQRAPKDGSLINVEFQGGDVTQAWWDTGHMQWQMPLPDGHVVAMDRERRDPPQDWWPVI